MGLTIAAVAAPIMVVALRPSAVRSGIAPAESRPEKPASPAISRLDLHLVPAQPAAEAPQPPSDGVIVAPGQVEPGSGEHAVGTVRTGRVDQVIANPGQRVEADDLLIRLDDNEAQARVLATHFQVRALREVRDRGASPHHQRRRRAEDSVWDAEQELAAVRAVLDRTIAARVTAHVPADEVAAARRAVEEAEGRLLNARDALGTILRDSGAPQPEAADAALAAARAQARVAEAELEAARIRAPIAGTVLAVNVKAGEVVRPEGEALAVIGDLDRVRVRAELDFADSGRVSDGQRAVVLDEAGRRLAEGTVASIAPVLTASRLRDPKIDIRAVTVAFETPPELPVGRRVAVRFVGGGSAGAQSAR